MAGPTFPSRKTTWLPPVGAPGSLPVSDVAGAARVVFDDGDGSVALYVWNPVLLMWEKVGDPDFGTGTGDVSGPAGATNNTVVVFDGPTGKIIKEPDSAVDFGTQNITNVGTVDGVTVSAHAARHVRGGADEIDGDVIAISFIPTNYTRTTAPAEVTDLTELTAHLAGIDNAIGSVSSTMQDTYDATGGVPHITLAAAQPLTIRDNAAPIGDVFVLEDNSGADFFAVSATDIDFGPAGRRLFNMSWPDTTGRMGTELFPDDFSITTATGTNNMAFFTDVGRTITLNIPGGGGLGNDTAPGFCSLTHTARFEDTGFLFAAQLLVNAAVQVECATNTVGPLYLFLDQYNTYADGGSRTCTQHNAMRAQPRWGPNINGGSITQTSCELFFGAGTIDATVGSATVTTFNCFAAKGVTLTAGGTCGTYNALDIVDITGPSTIRGINSAMNSGTFINHTGTASSFISGTWQLDDAIALRLGDTSGVDLSRQGVGVMRMVGFGGSNNEGLDWDFDTPTANNIEVTSSTGSSLQFNLDEISYGTSATGGNNNWFVNYAPGARSTNLAGDYSDILFTNAANVTVNHAITNLSAWKINAPGITVGGGGSIVDAANVTIQTAPSAGTNRYGLLITSNPSGGTLNYAFRQSNASALARFDGRLDINRGIALGGGATATLGTIGGSGPTGAGQAQWVEIDIGGVAHWIAVWT